MEDNHNLWEINYTSVKFFEDVMSDHMKVESCEKESDNCFIITKNDFTNLRVILVDRYVLSLADILQAEEDFGEFDCIVTCSNWNSYTSEAKDWGLSHRKGVFVVTEFLGALWWKHDYWKYIKKNKD
jgi:hypothetical protein